jgi:Uma2 family endonuclease
MKVMTTHIIKETATELIYTDTYEVTFTVPKPPSGADLPAEDGIPLESNWQRAQINLLIDIINHHWQERLDFYAGGNMFIYYSAQRLKREDALGPDFFVVKGVDKARIRHSWVVWEEGGKYPDVIIELVSPSTRQADESHKKERYEHVFHTPEYFLYYPDEQRLAGWQLVGGAYEPITPDDRKRLWSNELGLWLATWPGYSNNGEYNTWLRFYDEQGVLVPTEAEAATARAEAEAQARIEAEARATVEAQARAEAEAKIAALEAELARLKGRDT